MGIAEKTYKNRAKNAAKKKKNAVDSCIVRSMSQKTTLIRTKSNGSTKRDNI